MRGLTNLLLVCKIGIQIVLKYDEFKSFEKKETTEIKKVLKKF